jgi:hypothetical protein
VVGLFCTWFWIDRLLLTRSPAARANDIFLLAVTAFFLIFTVAILAAHPQLNSEGNSIPSLSAPAEEETSQDARN